MRISGFKLRGYRFDEEQMAGLFAEAMESSRRSAPALVRLALEDWLEAWRARGKPLLRPNLGPPEPPPSLPDNVVPFGPRRRA